MKEVSVKQIMDHLVAGNPLPLLRWGQYNSADGQFKDLCKVYRRLVINEQRAHNLVGVMPYEQRPQWQKDVLKKVSTRTTDIDGVLKSALDELTLQP